MANKAFKTLPTSIDIPTSLSNFKNREQAVWTGSQWRAKSTFSPNYGDTSSWPNESAYALERQGSLYLPSSTSGMRLGSNSGSSHTSNYESYGDGRWMPASIFNGIGFEVYQGSSGKHAIYLKKYALVFANKTSSSYRFWGLNTGASSPSQGYRFMEVSSSNSVTSSIRSWGSSWLFQGLILHVANNGGTGTTESHMEVYNLKVGHKVSTTGSAYRILPVTMRAYNARNKTSGLCGFTDPFTPK